MLPKLDTAGPMAYSTLIAGAF